MERLPSVTMLDGGAGFAVSVSSTIVFRIGQVSSWIRDKGRQIRSLPGNEELVRAVFSSERGPASGARFRVGENLNLYEPDGRCFRFRIYGVKNSGSSDVYTVVDLDEMRPYRLKENRAQAGDENDENRRLELEAEILLKLGPDPNLVNAHAALFFRGRLMLLTEYLSETLDKQLTNGTLPIRTALAYGVQLAGAVDRARGILPGFIHGDIKPGNCFINPKGHLKLGDFGFASADGIGQHCPDKSAARMGWGTNPYMAPEMFDSLVPYRGKADMYAFGVTLFELLAGERPFTGSSKEEIIEMHHVAEPPLHLLLARSVPSNIVDLIEECLSKSPADRPESFECVRNELSKTLADEFGVSASSDSVPELTDFELASKAFSFSALGLYGDAAACADLAVRRCGSSAEMLACKAITLTLASEIEEAYQASTSALMANAKSFIVLLAHGRTLVARGDLRHAEDYLLRALRLGPENCEALNLLGDLYLKMEHYEQASVCFERSRWLDPSQPTPFTVRGN